MFLRCCFRDFEVKLGGYFACNNYVMPNLSQKLPQRDLIDLIIVPYLRNTFYEGRFLLLGKCSFFIMEKNEQYGEKILRS